MADAKYPAIDSNGKLTLTARMLALVFAIILPAAAAVIAIIFINTATWTDLFLFLVMFFLSGLGVTVGYHRLFTHRAFETYPWLRYSLALLGGLSAQGAPIIWASQHRQHHAFPDEPGDPHSPYLHREPGFKGALKALWHSHYGHIFNQIETINPPKYVPDLEREPFLQWFERYSGLVAGAGLVLPGVAGWLISGTLMGGLTGMLWGGFVRLFVVTHVTGAVNSICHFFGTRRFNLSDESRNVWWLAPFTLGESWHQNHHAFPTSARHGLDWWEVDLSWWVILGMEKVGLAWNVVRVDPERKRSKMLKAPTSVSAH